MLVITLEILLFLGAILLPLVLRKTKIEAAKSSQPERPELSNYVVTEDGKLEEINKPHDTSLFQ